MRALLKKDAWRFVSGRSSVLQDAANHRLLVTKLAQIVPKSDEFTTIDDDAKVDSNHTILGSTSKSLQRLNADKHWIWNLNNCPVATKTWPTQLHRNCIAICCSIPAPSALKIAIIKIQNKKKDICEVLWFRRIWRETHSGDQWAKSCW
jgi:hypothetical protein